MYIKKETEKGIVKINVDEIQKLTEETIQMVPGIINVGKRDLKQYYNYLVNGKQPVGVILKVLEDNSVYVKCYVQVNSNSNISELSRQTQKLVKYTIEKHYQIKVSCVDVFIEGVL